MPWPESDFARRVRGCLDEQVMSLRALAREVPVDAGQLSRVLNGKRLASPELARRCDVILGTGDQLFRAALEDRRGGIGQHATEDATLDPSCDARPEAGESLQQSHARWSDPEVLLYYESLLAQHIRADNLLGPQLVLDMVGREAAVLRSAVRQTRGADRAPAVRMAVRYEEFLGWLNQDAGNLPLAMAHTDRARDLSTELRDAELAAYLLMRKSNIVSDAGDPALALALVDSALAQTADLPITIGAVLLRQRAHGLAGLGDGAGCEDAIGAALEATAVGADRGLPLASYCTGGYVAMEAAACWLDLDRPEDAVRVFDAAPDAWPPSLRRDYGLHLARRAEAHAGVADVSQACDLAVQAVTTFRQASSTRTLRQLQRLADRLAPWRTHPEVTAVRSTVASLVRSTR